MGRVGTALSFLLRLFQPIDDVPCRRLRVHGYVAHAKYREQNDTLDVNVTDVCFLKLSLANLVLPLAFHPCDHRPDQAAADYIVAVPHCLTLCLCLLSGELEPASTRPVIIVL